MGPQCATIGGCSFIHGRCTPPKMGQESRPQGWESRPGGRLRACGSTVRSTFAIQVPSPTPPALRLSVRPYLRCI